MRYLLVLLLTLAFAIPGRTQTYKDISWSYNIMLGVSNMMGDLGGSDFIGNENLDLDLRSSRLAIGAGGAFNRGGFSLGANVLFTRLYGNDQYTIQEFQLERNLSVRTGLLEANLIAELRPFGRSPVMNRLYVYGGVGAIYFQPKAEHNDEWIELRPLGTEGQNFLEDREQYQELDLVIPYGIGYKFKLTRSASLVLDLGIRKTFTDYLDDVSTTYADPTLLLESGGELAPILADRSLDGMAVGSERGNPEKNDSYAILSLKFEKILGGHSSAGCYYNRNPRKKRRVRLYQKKMFNKW